MTKLLQENQNNEIKRFTFKLNLRMTEYNFWFDGVTALVWTPIFHVRFLYTFNIVNLSLL
ncbi:MAG TPA: hypothetical protein V6D28_09410 [Leptolyngbyaceae cyanobacterium]